MNKKGFTLVEVLAVIGLLAVIIVIAVPAVAKIRENILEKEAAEQIKLIESSAVFYAQDKKMSSGALTVKQLLDEEYLQATVTLTNIIKNGSFTDNYRSTTNIDWDSTLNPNPPYVARNWTNGYNSGVSEPTTGYHAHFEPDTFGYMVAKFTNLNSIISKPKRWLGIRQTLAVNTIVNGHKYYHSMEIYSNTVGTKNYTLISNSSNGSTLTFDTFVSTSGNLNKWVRFSDLKTASDIVTSSSHYLYVYGHKGNEGIAYVKNVALVDLTETFGYGQEPSKDWCDQNIDFFNDTTTSAVKYLLNPNTGEILNDKTISISKSNGKITATYNN